MKDILFRGKTKEGEWIYGSLVNTTYGLKHKPKQHTKTWIIYSAFGNGGWFNVTGRKYVLPETVCQWTGLLDKNGKKIFENDWIIDEYGNTVEIIWTQGSYLFNKRNEEIRGYEEYCEVIGNIFDNLDIKNNYSYLDIEDI